MWRALAACVAAIAIVGCSQDTPEVTAVEPSDASSSTTTTEPTTTTVEPSTTTAVDQGTLEQVALDYFETVTNQTYTRGSGLAEDGSYADFYTFYLAEISKFYDATGPIDVDQIVDVTDGRLTMRTSSGGESIDIVYSDIEVSPEGVVTFAIDGVPLADRMSLIAEPVTNPAGVGVSTALVYLSAGGDRFALVEVDNQSGSDWNHQYSASFVASDGSQDDALEVLGADTVRAGARGLVFYVFDGDPADTSGQLYIDGFVDDFATDAGLMVPLD